MDLKNNEKNKVQSSSCRVVEGRFPRLKYCLTRAATNGAKRKLVRIRNVDNLELLADATNHG